MNPVVYLLALALAAPVAQATQRETASARAISRLQALVRETTAERDRLRTENASISAELAELKKQLEQEKTQKADLEAKLAAELAAEKGRVEQTKTHLENTTARLREVIDKYNALNKAKAELAAQHQELQSQKQSTASELKVCAQKNVKMLDAAKEVIAHYQNCQQKGVLARLLDTEPFTQISDVQFESKIQEYEDKLIKQKFHPSPAARQP